LQKTGMPLTVKQLNSRLFLPQLEEAVVNKIRDHWGQLGHPRALIFCKTIDSASRICKIINQNGFARAEVISSRQKPGERRVDREIKLMRFQDGEIDILCGVDVFNEGIDVPDVNLLVFMRVTHSRRIFVQQLGRGLRWQKGKVVRVLDFVSDIRRIAALMTMEKEYQDWRYNKPVEVHLPATIVHFDNDRAASFFREWLRDIAELEDASEESVLAFPPELEE
jgi:superfamily II DNA or RNA helicase